MRIIRRDKLTVGPHCMSIIEQLLFEQQPLPAEIAYPETRLLVFRTVFFGVCTELPYQMHLVQGRPFDRQYLYAPHLKFEWQPRIYIN